MKISSSFRKLTVLLVLSSLSLTVFNCSKKNDADPANQIEGSWKITNVYQKEGNAAEADQLPLILVFLPCFKDIVITFKSNGEVTATAPQACQSTTQDFVGSSGTAKYTVKSGKLTLTEADGSQSITDVSFSGNTMTWIDSETTGGITTTSRIVFAKQ